MFRSTTAPSAPPWLRLLLSLFFLSAATLVGVSWLRLPAAPWPLLLGALAAVLVLQNRALRFAPWHLVVSLGSAAALAAGLSLLPRAFAFDPELTERWTVLSTGFALLAAPLLGGLWTTLFEGSTAPAGLRGRRQPTPSLVGLAAVHVIVLELAVLTTFWLR